MNTWDAITSRRQVRDFSDEPLTDDHLHQILEAGRRAPSARNEQRWDFVVVRDQDQLERLSKVWQGASWITKSQATVAIVIPTTDDERTRRLIWFDLGQAAMQMNIAAAGLDVASGQAACEDQELAQEVLGFPENHECGLLIALGHPADRPLRPIKNPSRRAFDDVAHFDTW